MDVNQFIHFVLTMHLYTYLFNHQSIDVLTMNQGIHLYVFVLTTSVNVYAFVYLSPLYLTTHLPIYLCNAYLFIWHSTHRPFYPLIYLTFYQAVNLSIFIITYMFLFITTIVFVHFNINLPNTNFDKLFCLLSNHYG